MRTKPQFLIVSGLLLLPFGFTAGASEVMRVNDAPVSGDEFLWFMEQERPAVFQYFFAHYRLADGTNFWSATRGGTTPKAMLRQNTIQRVIREKVEQGVFLDFCLTTNISWSAMLDQLATVNQERQAAAARHEVLYGPVAYSPRMFYDNWKSTLQRQAREKMASEKLHITDRDLNHFYLANNSLFSSPEIWSLEIFTLRRNSSPAATNAPELKRAAKDLLRLAKSGAGAGQILDTCGHNNEVRVTREHYDDLTRDRLGELFAEEPRLQQVAKLKSGRSLQLPQSAESVQIVRCDTNISVAYVPFEQVRAQVRRRYVEARYNEWINSLAKSARVSVNQNQVDALLP